MYQMVRNNSYENYGVSEGFMTNHIEYLGLSGISGYSHEYYGLSEGSVAIPMITTDFWRFPPGESEVLFRTQPNKYYLQ